MNELENCPREILLVEDARRMLAEARTLDEVMLIRDQAEAIRMYLKQRDAGLDAQNDAADIRLQAEWRAGEILIELGLKAGRPPEKSSHDGRISPVKLRDLGINFNQSSRYQLLASIPVAVFKGHIEKTKAAGKELTTAGVLKLAARQHTARPPEDCDPLCGGDIVDSLLTLMEQGRKFRTIYADPPWRYGNQATRASTDCHYDTMTVEQICAEPVAQLVEDDAHLHLWTTNAFLFDARRVLEAWGFTYKSCFVWVKPQMGIGNYWRVAHEFLLLGVRGRLPFGARDEMSWGQYERSEHSAKPEAVRLKVERVSPGPFLEMYGRISLPDSPWTVYGNQVSRRYSHERMGSDQEDRAGRHP